MGKRGRLRKIHTCPLCLSPDGPTRSSNSGYFDCRNCGARLVMDNGQLRQTRSYNPRPGEELLLSRDSSGQVTGVYRVDWVLTVRYSTALIEKEPLCCSVEEYEAMQE